MELKCLLRVRLAEKEMRLTELATISELNYNYLSDLQNGRKEPGIRNALIIADALNLKIEDIWKIKK